MRQKTITLYKFDELPTDAAKEKARQWYREATGTDMFYSESVVEEFIELTTALGFTVATRKGTQSEKAISWDTNPIDAAFDATWAARNFDVIKCASIRNDRPKDKETHRITYAFASLAAKFPYAYGTAEQGRRMQQKGIFDCGDDELDMPESTAGDDFNELCRDLAAQFATDINAAYEHSLSDETVDDMLRANEYEFTEEGDIS